MFKNMFCLLFLDMRHQSPLIQDPYIGPMASGASPSPLDGKHKLYENIHDYILERIHVFIYSQW